MTAIILQRFANHLISSLIATSAKSVVPVFLVKIQKEDVFEII
jgi:hypothetical protein